MKNPKNVNPSQTSRKDHVANCKVRALEYLERGDLQNAVTCMLSDMEKHPQCSVNPHLALLGMMEVSKNNASAVRRWIEGFN